MQSKTQEAFEAAFHDGEFMEVEGIYMSEEELTQKPAKPKPAFGGEIGATHFGEVLELSGTGDAAATTCHETEDDSLFEEFFHVE